MPKVVMWSLPILIVALGIAVYCVAQDSGSHTGQTLVLHSPPVVDCQKSGSSGDDSLPASILAELTTQVNGHFSLYLEDLTSGKSWGVDENKTYDAWSLLKLSTMITVLKKVERKELSLQDNVTMSMDLPGQGAAPPCRRAYLVSINALLADMIALSDNIASAGLALTMVGAEFQECLRATGIPCAPPGEPGNRIPPVSPKQFANVLRSLDSATYLNRQDSDFALSLLSSSVYDTLIRAGVPRRVSVAHKVGFNANSGDYHDCGIVFLPNRRYILCIMSTGTNVEEAERVFSAVSRRVYEFMGRPRQT